MRGGAVDLDGRIEPGDLIIRVNNIDLTELTNDEAVLVLRNAAKELGPITLSVARCLDQES